MASAVDWMLSLSSCLELAIFSIIFLVVFITLHSMCINCFSQTPVISLHPGQKEVPSSFHQPERSEDLWSCSVNGSDSEQAVSCRLQDTAPQVPPRSHTRSHTVVYSQQHRVYSHTRAESDGYFSQGMIPRLQDVPVFSFGATDSDYMTIQDLPPLPSKLYSFRDSVVCAAGPDCRSESRASEHTAAGTLHLVDASSSGFGDDDEEQPYSIPGLYSGEEHPYECIDAVVKLKDFYFSYGDEAEENSCPKTFRAQSGQMAEPTLLVSPPLSAPDLNPHPADEDADTVYAAVNWKSKSQKIREMFFPPDLLSSDEEEDMSDEAPPPVPEKRFE